MQPTSSLYSWFYDRGTIGVDRSNANMNYGKKKNKGRVYPGREDEEGFVNGGFEMDNVNDAKSTK